MEKLETIHCCKYFLLYFLNYGCTSPYANIIIIFGVFGISGIYTSSKIIEVLSLDG